MDERRETETAVAPKRQGRSPKQAPDWLKDQLRPLLAEGERLAAIDPGVAHAYGLHSGLKLAGIRHVAETFATIAHKKVQEGTYRKAVYLDLFAGCGINRMGRPGYLVAGSPFAGLSMPGFDQLVFVEQNDQFFRTLSSRLALDHDPRVIAIPGDCNERISDVLEDVGKKGVIALAVLDQETLQAKWETVERISESISALDLIVTLPTGVERVLAAAVAGDRESKTLTSVTGKTVAEVLEAVDGSASGALTEQIRTVLGRRLGDSVLIRDAGNQPKYWFQIYTRRTLGGSPYVRSYLDCLKRIKALTAAHVEGALNDLSGRSLFSVAGN